MRALHFDLSYLADALKNGVITSVELTEECLRRMNAEHCAQHFVYVDADGAMAAARASDARRAEGSSLGWLDGIPFAAEDRFCVKGMATENRCGMLRDYRPPYDAYAIQRLREAGAVLVGKLKTDGFLSGRTEEKNVREGLVGNAGAIPFALMAETGGSLMGHAARDAATCIGPLVSRWGLISCAPSFDCVGVMTGTARDCASLVDFLNNGNQENAHQERRCKRIALWGMTEEAISPVGAECCETELPDMEAILQAYKILSAVESASEMAMYDGIRFGVKGGGNADIRGQTAAVRGKSFSFEEQKLILLGTALLMDEHRTGCYHAARGWREKLQRHLRDLFKKFDMLVCPLSDETAFFPGFAGLSAVSCEGLLWMTPREREADLLAFARQNRLERSVER